MKHNKIESISLNTQHLSKDLDVTYHSSKEDSRENKASVICYVRDDFTINYDKARASVLLFTRKIFGKYLKNSDWKIEVWLDEESSLKDGANIICSVALHRQGHEVICSKEKSGGLNKAIQKALVDADSTLQNLGGEYHQSKKTLNVVS